MKRILLGILLFTSISTLHAQIEIRLNGTGPDLSGTTIDFNVDQFDSAEYAPSFYVTNNTGANQQWRVRRVKQNVPSSWMDQVCWPPQCYSTSGDVYTTPSTPGFPAPTVVNGTDSTTATTNSLHAVLKPLITFDGSTNATALYMYYLLDNNDNYVDSIGIRYNLVLGINETTPKLSMTVSPNPADSYVNIKIDHVQGATIQVVDVLGNIVLKETVMGSSKTINTDSFRNGVYFVRVEAENHQPINRKVIVRH